MNLKSILTLALLLFSIKVFSQYKYIQKLGSIGTINLPEKPKLKQAKGINIYFSNYNGVFYIAQAGDIGGGLKDIFAKDNTDSVYTQYIRGTVEGAKGKLFYKDKIKIDGHEAVQFGYKAKLKDQDTYRYQRIIALNDTILMCGIWASDSISKDSPSLNEFFKGFKTKNKRELELDRAASLGHKTGYAIGVLIVIGIFLSIGLGFVFLLKKLMYKKNKV